jgi:hypothetical protein
LIQGSTATITVKNKDMVQQIFTSTMAGILMKIVNKDKYKKILGLGTVAHNVQSGHIVQHKSKI